MLLNKYLSDTFCPLHYVTVKKYFTNYEKWFFLFPLKWSICPEIFSFVSLPCTVKKRLKKSLKGNFWIIWPDKVPLHKTRNTHAWKTNLANL